MSRPQAPLVKFLRVPENVTIMKEAFLLHIFEGLEQAAERKKKTKEKQG